MKHVLRKYLSRRGSALFMVLSLMTALMVLVMAMYFSVVASRETQYKVFYQEQSYRSAMSISDAIMSGLQGDVWEKVDSDSNSLFGAILALPEGGTISTNGNDFKSLALAGTKEDQGEVGAYSVTITRLPNETINNQKTRIYDVAITVSNGGVIDTTHTYIHIIEPDAKATKGKTQIFASTGYVPNDVFLEGIKSYTDLFYDNEFVYLSDQGGENRFMSDLYAGNSVILAKTGGDPGLTRSLTWAIRRDFIQKATLQLAPSGSRGQLLVGGDMTMQGDINNADIYVLGDFRYDWGNFNNCRLFVYGDISGSPNVNNTCMANNRSEHWKDNDSLPSGVMSSGDMAKKLDVLTSSMAYAKWEINDNAPAKDYYISYLDPNSSDYDPHTIKFDKDHYTWYIDWQDGYTITDYFGEGNDLHYTPYVIEDITVDWTGEVEGGDATRCPTIVIDTGDDPANQVILRLNPNRDYDGDDFNETFEWSPVKADGNYDYKTMTVLVRGKGSVVMNIPDDEDPDIPDGITVTYQSSNSTTVMHETWYAILGGQTKQMGAAGNRDTFAFTQNGGSALTYSPETVMQYIHTGCNESCALCDYTVDDSAECSECGNKIISITCDEHTYFDPDDPDEVVGGMEYTFCPECDKHLEPAKDGDDYYGLCSNRISPSKIAAAVDGLSAEWKAILKESGDGTNWYYPHTNIFIVSCDESADIRLATHKNGGSFEKASLWGFVYAPYMTYKGMGNGAGWVVFCGGMVVSDYILKNYDIYLGCYPDQMPQNRMNEQNASDMLEPIVPKTWKVSLAGY